MLRLCAAQIRPQIRLEAVAVVNHFSVGGARGCLVGVVRADYQLRATLVLAWG